MEDRNHKETVNKITSLIKAGDANVMVAYILKECKNKDIESFVSMLAVITEAYYETAIDKWRLTNYEEAVSYFREAGNFCDAIKAGAKDSKLKESISFFCHFFESLKDLAIFDCEFQKIFDSTDFKELFSSCIMTAEVALNLDILKKANENRKYLDKWKEKFPVFHVIFNARMFCLFSLFNTLIPLWGHLLTKEGKGVLDPQKFRPYELDLDFEKSRNILANLGFLKAKQALDALENFILALAHYRNHKKIEDFTFEEVAELFGILNAGSMRTSKSYIGFAVQGIEELKQKHLDLEKLITPKMRKELWITKPGGKEEAIGLEKSTLEIDYISEEPIVKINGRIVEEFKTREVFFARFVRLGVARKVNELGRNGRIYKYDEPDKSEKSKKFNLYVGGIRQTEEKKKEIQDKSKKRDKELYDLRKFLGKECRVYGLNEEAKKKLIVSRKGSNEVNLEVLPENITIKVENLKKFKSNLSKAQTDKYGTSPSEINERLIKDVIEAYKNPLHKISPARITNQKL